MLMLCQVASVVSDSVRPHRWQPTRLCRPWDSLGKNTGVGCHFLLQCMKREKWKWSRSVVSNSSRPHGLQPTRLLCPWDFPDKSTGVGCHCLKKTMQYVHLLINIPSSMHGVRFLGLMFNGNSVENVVGILRLSRRTMTNTETHMIASISIYGVSTRDKIFY